MQWHEVEGNWPQLQNRVRRHWSRLTQEDVTQITGKREILVKRLQERYGFSRQQAEREVEAWAYIVTRPSAA
jgi:uncharacterized protein YjbJ (UPF0337 family)